MLELGCGSGLMGIAALLLGCKGCVFQDYNEEVISLWTLPNVGLNLPQFQNRVGFVSGDWADFQDKSNPAIGSY